MKKNQTGQGTVEYALTLLLIGAVLLLLLLEASGYGIRNIFTRVNNKLSTAGQVEP